MDFYDEVKRLAAVNGVSVESVVQKATGTASGHDTWAGWKRRGVYPRLDDGYRLAHLLNVPVEHFFEDSNTKKSEEKNLRLLNLFNQLDEKQQQYLEQLIKSFIKK